MLNNKENKGPRINEQERLVQTPFQTRLRRQSKYKSDGNLCRVDDGHSLPRPLQRSAHTYERRQSHLVHLLCVRNKIFIIFYLFVSFAGARFKTRANSAKMGNAATRMTATKNVYGLLFEHKSIWQTRQRGRGSPHSPSPPWAIQCVAPCDCLQLSSMHEAQRT